MHLHPIRSRQVDPSGCSERHAQHSEPQARAKLLGRRPGAASETPSGSGHLGQRRGKHLDEDRALPGHRGPMEPLRPGDQPGVMVRDRYHPGAGEPLSIRRGSGEHQPRVVPPPIGDRDGRTREHNRPHLVLHRRSQVRRQARWAFIARRPRSFQGDVRRSGLPGRGGHARRLLGQRSGLPHWSV